MRIKRFLSGFLAVTLALSCINWRAASAQNVQTSNTTNSTYATEISDTNLEALTENSQILEHVDSEQFFDAEHIARLPEEETLDSYVFLNRDGSKSIYYMGQPVKYVDSNGVIQEKDTTLIRSNGGYCMRNNDIDLHIPDAVATGITVACNNQTVKVTPQGGSGSAQQYDNSIVYYDYYGKGTILRYTPMLSGVKEDIILAKYTGQNSFTFLLETNGLQLYEDQGQYYLADNQDVSAAFYLGQIAVYDAIGRPDLGTMTAETIIPGQKYRLTIAANESFLLDPETVYPVTIDPTVTVRDSADVSGTVEDAPVFSGYANRSFGDYVFNNIGYVDGYKLARTAFRLTSLLADSNYNQLSAEQLNSVSFHLKGSGGQFANLSLHALTENATWTESTLTWNNLGAYSETAYTTVRMGSSVWKTFDITALAKDWKTGAQNPDCGFVLISDSTTSSVSTFSAEYSTVDYRPYVVVNYTGTIALSQVSATLSVGGTLALTATTTPTGQVVSWASEDPTVAEVSEDGVVTALSLGTTTITASLEDGTSAECEVTVVAKSISLNYNTSDKIASVYKGETITLIATTEPASEEVTWTSLTPEIATVENGVVTGVSTGDTVIRASLSDGTYAECKLVVLDNTISMDASVTITRGDVVTLIADTAPPNLPIIWSSSNPTVVSVSHSGEIIGLKAGDAVITASLLDGTLVQCTIIVQCEASLKNPPNDMDVENTVRLLLDTDDPIDITWTSSNENVATVDSKGVVTGIKPGTVTITATSPHLAKALSCTIYVTLEDGIYYFQNLNSGYYLHIPNGPIQHRNGLIQNALLDPQHYSEHEQIRQLWKIKHLSAGKYTIRPILLPQMCLCVDINNNVFVEDRGTNDSIYWLMEDSQWKISVADSGYIITSIVFDKGSLQVVNSSHTQGVAVNVASIIESDSVIWNLRKVDNPPIGAALLDTNTGKIIPYSMQVYLALNEEWNLEQKNLMTISYSASSINQSFEWTTTDTSIASVDSSGTIIGIKEGRAVISAASKATGIKINIVVSVLPVANGTFLIKNRQNGYFMTASAQSTADGSAQVYLSQHSTQVNLLEDQLKYDLQGWTVSSCGNGYYAFEFKEIASVYLAVMENSEGKNYVDLLMSEDVPYEAQWQIEKTADGLLKIIPRCLSNQQIVLFADSGASGGKIPFTLREYTPDLDFRDEWEMADWGAFIATKSPELSVSIQLLDELYTDPEWYALVLQAVNIWNQSIPGVNISISTNPSAIQMSLVDEPGETWAGQTQSSISNGGYHAIIRINTAKMGNDQLRLHVILHEIGHIFGLNDNPPVVNPNDSLMHYESNQEEILSPCVYDILNIKFLYNIA